MHRGLASAFCIVGLCSQSHMQPHERLKEAREKAGFETAADAAAAMGIASATYSQHENGLRGFKARAADYAARFGTTPEWLLYGRGKTASAMPVPVNRTVPVIGSVQAGVFNPIPDEPEVTEVVPLVMSGFEGASLYALRVVGNSMNMHYPDGTLVIVCPVQEIGFRDGDHVIVRHMRNGLAETTVKEVVKERVGIALWPRSTDAAFQAPYRLKREADADDGHEVIGVVVSSYVVRPVQRKPMIQI